MKIIFSILILFSAICYADTDLNVKIDNPDGTLMSTTSFPDCTSFKIAVGSLHGNVRLTPTGCKTPEPVTVPAICPNNGFPLQVISKELDWNIGAGIAIYSDSFKGGQVYIYKMTTGLASSTVAVLSLAEYAATEVPEKTVVISQKPCDFDPQKIGNAWGIGPNPMTYFSVGLANDQNMPVLKPQTIYYINIINAHWETPTIGTCSEGKDCRFVMSLRH